MSAKARIKLFIFILALSIALVILGLSFVLISGFITAFNQSADPASIFRGHALFIPAPDEARWTSVDRSSGKSITRSQQEEIIGAYWQGWDALLRAQQTHDTTDLTTYWAGTAYRRAVNAVVTDRGQFIRHHSHRLRLRYLSDDGSVITFQDDFQLTMRVDRDEYDVTVSADVVMTLDQGFWRIRSIVLNYG